MRSGVSVIGVLSEDSVTNAVCGSTSVSLTHSGSCSATSGMDTITSLASSSVAVCSDASIVGSSSTAGDGCSTGTVDSSTASGIDGTSSESFTGAGSISDRTGAGSVSDRMGVLKL